MRRTNTQQESYAYAGINKRGIILSNTVRRTRAEAMHALRLHVGNQIFKCEIMGHSIPLDTLALPGMVRKRGYRVVAVRVELDE